MHSTQKKSNMFFTKLNSMITTPPIDIRMTSWPNLILFIFLLLPSLFFSAPHIGTDFSLKQPDGSQVQVKVYGDEYYQRIETPDGYTLVRDEETDWICYAKLNEEGSELVSTGVVYNSFDENRQESNPLLATLKKQRKINLDAIKRKRENTKRPSAEKLPQRLPL